MRKSRHRGGGGHLVGPQGGSKSDGELGDVDVLRSGCHKVPTLVHRDYGSQYGNGACHRQRA
jgi:hypothetical protein